MVNETVIQKDLIVNGLGSFGDRQAADPSQIANDLEVFNSTGDASLGIIADNASVSALNFANTNSNIAAEIVFDHATNTFEIKSDTVSQIIISPTTTTITGDLTVNGTTTTVNSANLEIDDNKIRLNKNETGAGITAGTAGLEIERGTENDVCWVYNDGIGKQWWEPTDPAGTAGASAELKTLGNIQAIDSTTAGQTLDFNSTGAIIISRGSVAERPGSPVDGMIRYNSDDNVLEGRINTAWLTIGAFTPGSGFLELTGGTVVGDITISSGGQLILEDGLATAPSMTFSADINTGLFRVSGDVLGIATGGVVRMQVGVLETDLFTDLDMNNNTILNPLDPTLGNHVGDRDYNDARYINATGGDAITGTFTTQDILPDTNITYDIGSTLFKYNEVFATTFNGTATAALYADLAERYAADMDLEPGDVVVFGGEAEITKSYLEMDTAIAGVISTDPAYMMNSEAGPDKTHPYVALKGKVPCKVTGPVKKGDLIVTASLHGHGKSAGKRAPAYTAFARALEDCDGGTTTIMVSVI